MGPVVNGLGQALVLTAAYGGYRDATTMSGAVGRDDPMGQRQSQPRVDNQGPPMKQPRPNAGS